MKSSSLMLTKKVFLPMPSLFSIHDRTIGNFKRYSERNFREACDDCLFSIEDLWLQYQIGVGSFFYFKLLKIELKSKQGVYLVLKRGSLYNKYLKPLESFCEKLFRIPFIGVFNFSTSKYWSLRPSNAQ